MSRSYLPRHARRAPRRILFAGVACLGLLLCAGPGQAFEPNRSYKDHEEFKWDPDPNVFEGRCREGNCQEGRGIIDMHGGGLLIGHFKRGKKHGIFYRIGPEGDRQLQVWDMGVKKYDNSIQSHMDTVLDKTENRMNRHSKTKKPKKKTYLGNSLR